MLFKVLPQRWMSHLLVVADSGKSEQIIDQLNSSIKRNSVIVGAVLIDDDACRSDVSGIPVVCSLENASPFICREWIDEVIICTERLNEKVQKLIENCKEMEVPVFVCGISKTANDMHRLVEISGDNSAATAVLYKKSFIKSFGKRCLDVAGGLLGSLLALIIMTVLGPIIQRESPGPILYKQERIGKNGRHFKMIKLRTMHLFHLPVFMVSRYNPKPEYLLTKRLIDIIISATALIVFSPIMLFTALAIHGTDGGPVFYRQARLTKDKRKFITLNLRLVQIYKSQRRIRANNVRYLCVTY